MFQMVIRNQQATYSHGAPKKQIQSLATERYGGDDYLKGLFGRAVDVRSLALQADCLLEWHSFLSRRQQDGRPAGDSTTVDYFKYNYQQGALTYLPSFVHEPLHEVIPTLRLIAKGLRKGGEPLSLDEGLSEVLRNIHPDHRLVCLAIS